jgi:HD-GYP domain-containing protein (c-di-GMP phosphodiesterase class II)
MNPAAAPDTVNAHYLGHVVGTGETHQVEASEDIVAGNGTKLLAKGARISADVQERLLQHKLQKPLEECVQVADGITGASLAPVAERLLDEHPLLAALCASDRARPVSETLGALPLTPPMRSLLTVYASHQPGRLEHAVGVAMLALGLARRLQPGEIDRHRLLAAAGLLHDVGELYIDPALLQRGRALEPEEWRHIASHPVIGERVLHGMAGGGPAMAHAVGQHHERLDGFGYPRGSSGDAFTVNGQVLAASEWLMALAERGSAPLKRASMASRLVPGEFDRALLHAVEKAAGAADEAGAGVSTAPLASLAPTVDRIGDTLQRFRTLRPEIEAGLGATAPSSRAVLDSMLRRLVRMQASFSSTGFDVGTPSLLLAELESLGDPRVQLEVDTVVRELEWRMRELERESRQRASRLPEGEADAVYRWVDRLFAEPSASAP